MVVSPVTGTTPRPLSSVPSSTTTDSNTSPSNPPSTTIATELNTSASNSSRVKIIGGSIGGGGLLIVLTVIFLLHRQRSGQRSGQARDQLQDFNKVAAIIHPFSPKAPVPDYSREQKEPPSMPAWNRKVAQMSDHQVIGPTSGEQSIDPQQPQIEPDGSESDETSTLGDDSRYRTMQAQIQLLMQRVDRMEAVEEAPPEYVSDYRSSR
ncbi:hypothetical protein PM082_014790 [Marasmius tenuissimus]|nr:hypothetical protein PM082_014790 [Marasmius tenuissimus]